MFNLKAPEACSACGDKSPQRDSCQECAGTGLDAVSKRIRDCLAARPGFSLIEIDRSQIEVRVMGNLARDPVLKKAYDEGLDVHTYVSEQASKITGTTVRRTPTKRGVFGTAYGLTPKGMHSRFGFPLSECKQVIKVVEQILGACIQYREKVKSEVRRLGYAQSFFCGKPARIRPLWDIALEGNDDAERARKSNAENGAFNMLVQAEANDYTLWAHARIVEWIHAEGLASDVQLVLSVYDSITLHCRDELVPYVAWKADQIMNSSEIQSEWIRFASDCKVGSRWGSLKKFKMPASLAEALNQCALLRASARRS
jgi:DNA polymerase-1